MTHPPEEAGGRRRRPHREQRQHRAGRIGMRLPRWPSPGSSTGGTGLLTLAALAAALRRHFRKDRLGPGGPRPEAAPVEPVLLEPAPRPKRCAGSAAAETRATLPSWLREQRFQLRTRRLGAGTGPAPAGQLGQAAGERLGQVLELDRGARPGTARGRSRITLASSRTLRGQSYRHSALKAPWDSGLASAPMNCRTSRIRSSRRRRSGGSTTASAPRRARTSLRRAVSLGPAHRAVGGGYHPHVHACGRWCRPAGRTPGSAESGAAWSAGAGGISPISSRNRVPPWACSIRPRLGRCAVEWAPRSYPKSSLSSSSAGMAAQSMGDEGAPPPARPRG